MQIGAENEEFEENAKKFGLLSLKLKLLLLKNSDFTVGGGFLFAMCSATDSYDIARERRYLRIHVRW